MKISVHRPPVVSPLSVLDHEAKAAVQKAGEVALGVARATAPRGRTGALQASLRSRVGRTGTGYGVNIIVSGSGARQGGRVGPAVYTYFVDLGTGLYGPRHSKITRRGKGAFGGILRESFRGQPAQHWTRKARLAANAGAATHLEGGAIRAADRLARGVPA